MASIESAIIRTSVIAKILLEADRFLTIDEILAYDNVDLGKTFGKSILKRDLSGLAVENLVVERKTKISREHYEIRYGPGERNTGKRDELRHMGGAFPPLNIKDDPNWELEMRRVHYSGTEMQKAARAAIALRAIKRLIISGQANRTETAAAQARSALFLAKKGDKHQLKEALNHEWQYDLLSNLEKLRIISIDTKDQQIPLYMIKNSKLAQDVIDFTGDTCIYTLLWPENPCTKSHSVEIQMALEEKVKDIPSDTTLPEEKDPITTLEKVNDVSNNFLKEVKDAVENEEEKLSTIGNDEIRLLVESQIEIIKIQGEHIEKLKNIMNLQMELVTKQLTMIAKDVVHVHSKLDKLHEDQVLTDTYINEIAKATESASSEASLGSIRKKMHELEKSFTQHDTKLENINKLVKSGLSEVANVVAKLAQPNNSAILQKISDLEHCVDTTLDEVKALAKSKSQTRMLEVVERMNSMSKELKHLETVMPALK